ncbi:MAG: DNA polymerase I [Planctomycetes bacterium]|nr:DNA polymerase I [Planctomycetota bacterium]
MAERPRLFLIDGHALAYRSYFAFIRNPLINSKGQNTSAIYGFASAVLRLIEKESPDRIAVAFDSQEPTFRHGKFPEYKATREKMPDEMREQLPVLEEVVAALGLHALRCPGYEADDVIGTLARRAEAAGWDTVIVTGDKDFMQLVGDRITLLDLKKKGAEDEVIDRAAVEAKFGVPPDKVVDVLGLMGDTSDNVPGAQGVGEKTALELVRAYGSLAAVLDHAAEVKHKRVREGLLASREQALLSRELVTIRTDAPVAFDPEQFGRHTPDGSRLIQLFEQLEFPSLIEKVRFAVPAPSEAEGAAPSQLAYHTVSDEGALEALLARLRAAEEFVLDTETTSSEPTRAEIVGLSFAFREREAYYVPVGDCRLPIADCRLEGRRAAPESDLPLFSAASHPQHLAPDTQHPLRGVLDRLRPILEDPAICKGGQNIKYDAVVLANYDIEVRGIAFDTMVESYLLDPSQRQHNLDLLALKHLNIRKIPTSDLIGKGKEQISMADVPVAKVAPYACEDADVTLRLHRLFAPKLAELGLDSLCHDVETPLVGVLARMESRGVKVNLDLLAALSAEFAAKMNALAAEVHRLAGEEFNINSTQQLGAVLFDKLQIQKGRGGRVRKTKTGFATSVEALEDFADEPIVKAILEYRGLAKLKGTYVDAFPTLVNPRTGRIHTSFNQTVTSTGRLSSSEPNLQNIPIRTELGRKIREAFVPGDPSRRLVCADYSQIELRILAHYTGDPNLIAAFARGEDIHRRTASEVFETPIEAVTPEMRSRAKAINFGIIYGMGPQRLAHDTGITLLEAQEFIARYFRRYPLIKKHMEDTVAAAERDGFVTTLLGRRRPIPEIYSDNQGTRSAAERAAINTPIQGSAADLIKVAMVHLDRRLRDAYPDAWMILQVHDELVFDVTAAQAEPVAAIVRTEMEAAMPLRVPIKVDITIGTTWAK